MLILPLKPEPFFAPVSTVTLPVLPLPAVALPERMVTPLDVPLVTSFVVNKLLMKLVTAWTVPVKLAALEIVWLLIAPEVIVPVPAFIFPLLVERPPGMETTKLLLPNVKPVAVAVAMLSVPALATSTKGASRLVAAVTVPVKLAALEMV
jgi:hypothetical protein